MATLTLRAVKGAPLTSAEVDNNFSELDNNKVQLGGDIGGSTSSPVVIKLSGRALSSAAPTTGQAIVWNGASWIPSTVSTASGAGSSTVTSVVTSTVTPTISSTTTTYPIFGAYANNTLQTFTSGIAQKVLFQAEEVDTANCYANSRFTPNVAGWYQINSEIRFDGVMGPNNELLVSIYKNGNEHKRGYNSTGVSPNAGSSTWFAMQVSAMVYANGTTDYFEIYAQHGNSSNITITAINAPQITWWNGFYVPYQVLTSVSASTTISSAVTSTVIQGGGYGVTVLDDITNQFAQNRRIFTLKNNRIPITENISYGDNKDFTVQIGGRLLNAAVPQTTTLGPWIQLYVAERARSYKVTGSRIIFYSHVAKPGQSAEIRINTVSASRQTRSRYPLSPNTIVLGD